ncbi:hypothetical protein [Shewanella sp. GXUN23E]|uniref:hypothetical protein n=1 Tax=Shewanella sp. GXUN23E TaxID=3422498 RepID=UPI003D7EDC07
MMRLIAAVLLLLLSGAVRADVAASQLQESWYQTCMATETAKLELELASLKADLALKQALNQNALEALQFQAMQTMAISAVVLLMVIFGLWLSYLQFRRDEADGGQVNELKIGSAGVSISSQVIGLIILVIAFWFFSAYVDKVYKLDTSQLDLAAQTIAPAEPVVSTADTGPRSGVQYVLVGGGPCQSAG